jgi:hypothetical protein
MIWLQSINSGEELILAVEQMRICQRDYARTNRPDSRRAAQKLEDLVDEALERRRIRQAQKKQRELFGGKT